jgi:hypothetical protein
VHKFKNSLVALLISYEGKVKDVFFGSSGVINIHCKTTEGDPYMFTICVEYSKAAFNLLVFWRIQSMNPYSRRLKSK